MNSISPQGINLLAASKNAVAHQQDVSAQTKRKRNSNHTYLTQS